MMATSRPLRSTLDRSTAAVPPRHTHTPLTATSMRSGANAAAEDRSKVDLSGREVAVRIELHAGAAAATVWTNDLSHGYVHENSAYSS